MNLKIRLADIDDSRIVWEWRNDNHTRKMSKKSDLVPWEEHQKWFKSSLNSSNRVIFIGLLDDKRMGIARYDEIRPAEFEVSINIGPQYRGKKWSKKIILDSISELCKMRTVSKIFAETKSSNVTSSRLFASAGFVKVRSQESMNYYVYEIL